MHPFTQVLGDVASQYMVLAKYRKANLIESVLLGTQFSEVLYVEKKKIYRKAKLIEPVLLGNLYIPFF